MNGPFQGGTSFVDHLCYLCLVFVMLSRLFIAALCSPVWKRLPSWLLFLIVFLPLSHVVSFVRVGLIVSIPDLCHFSYFPTAGEGIFNGVVCLGHYVDFVII